MIKQGEKILFQGTFQEKIGDNWVDKSIQDYTVKARIVNSINRQTYDFDSETEGDFNISITSDYMRYSFSIKPKYTAQMLGECSCEIALVDKDSNPIIANEANFIIKESSLGRTLAQT